MVSSEDIKVKCLEKGEARSLNEPMWSGSFLRYPQTPLFLKFSKQSVCCEHFSDLSCSIPSHGFPDPLLSLFPWDRLSFLFNVYVFLTWLGSLNHHPLFLWFCFFDGILIKDMQVTSNHRETVLPTLKIVLWGSQYFTFFSCLFFRVIICGEKKPPPKISLKKITNFWLLWFQRNYSKGQISKF